MRQSCVFMAWCQQQLNCQSLDQRDVTPLATTSKSSYNKHKTNRIGIHLFQHPPIHRHRICLKMVFYFWTSAAVASVARHQPAFESNGGSSLWCPHFHGILGHYDPSGPILVDGTWHGAVSFFAFGALLTSATQRTSEWGGWGGNGSGRAGHTPSEACTASDLYLSREAVGLLRAFAWGAHCTPR
jgi:hypothetical protein